MEKFVNDKFQFSEQEEEKIRNLTKGLVGKNNI